MTVTLRLSLDKLIPRAATLFAGLGLCLWLGLCVQKRYVISQLAAEGVNAKQPDLARAAQHFPNSARLQAQLATITLARALEDETSLAQAESDATRAVQLSPHNAKFRLLLAATQSVSGDLAAQEEHLRAAVALAPHYPLMRWQLANLLVRAGKTTESLAEFRQAVTTKPALLAATLELLWEVSAGRSEILSQAAGARAQNRLRLAQFLLQQGRPAEAAQVFNQIEQPAKLSAPETAEFLNQLLDGGQPELARRLWGTLLGEHSEIVSLIWNGGFEAERAPGLAQFDWQLRHSEYARVSIEQNFARSGARALRVDFYGRDTTKLTDEVQQLVVLRPGARYRLECYAKAVRLVTPEGPRLVVRARATGQVAAATPAVSAELQDWQRLAVEFSTPADQTIFWVALQRIPKFSYDAPTQGTIWFDDCILVEVRSVQAD